MEQEMEQAEQEALLIPLSPMLFPALAPFLVLADFRSQGSETIPLALARGLARREESEKSEKSGPPTIQRQRPCWW